MVRGAETVTAPPEGVAGFYPRSRGRGDAECGENGRSEVVHCRAGSGFARGYGPMHSIAGGRIATWSAGRASRRLALLLAVLVVGRGATSVRAGGGPENVLVVVNPANPDSLEIANAYVTLRRIPALNVVLVPWDGSPEVATLEEFKTRILAPVRAAIAGRRLGGQIDCVAYSAGFPWRIDFSAALPAEIAKQDSFPSGSLTGMTMLHEALDAGGPAWLDPESNDYYRRTDAAGVPSSTIGFRSWYGWGPRGELLESGGNHYLLATSLGVTSGRGNRAAEVVAALESAAAADGTRPPGTIYFMTNADVRTTTRSGSFPGTVRALEGLGVAAQIVEGVLPERRQSVAGLMTGTQSFDWKASGCRLVPGAICDNLTSFGGVFTPGAGQTPLSEFIRAGAAGSSGTVIEPYAIQAKFPHPSLHVHYARGANLAEAFYQSVQAPYQLLVVGDPLCQPWAVIPTVDVAAGDAGGSLAAGATLSGTVTLQPKATLPGVGTVDRYELFVDGLRTGRCGPGGRLALDTTAVANGYHELRVVAFSGTAVETQGRRIVPVTFANGSRTLELDVQPRRVSPQGTLRIQLTGDGIEGATVFVPGRVLGRTTAASATLEVAAATLGRGTVAIQATGRGGTTAGESVNAVPVTVEVVDAP